MQFLRDLPIQSKFTWITMTISTVALLLAGGTFAVYEATVFRNAMSSTLASTGMIIAANCAAPLEFGDPVAARETLAALEADPHIVTAAVYDQSGQLFATFSRTNTSSSAPAQAPQGDGRRIDAARLKMVEPILSDGKRIGSIYIESDMTKLYAKLGRYAGLALVALLCVWFVAFALSSALQRVISRPILDLARKATLVSDRRDYSIRAEGRRGDEIGVLIDRFNEMLFQIGERDAALKQSHDELESRVEERTRELRAEIREKEKVQKELWTAKQAAEQSSVAKSSFLANMSHELRTPLNAIIGYSEMLEEDARSAGTSQLSIDLGRIHSAGRHLLDLINDILDLSKIEAGRMEIYIERFDLDELIQEVMNTIRPLILDNRLEVRDATDFGEIETDRTKLKQTLLNLLSNACKFTEQGTIVLTVVREAAANEELIVFRVTDDGIGMSKEQQSRLFQEFMQVDSSPARKHGGSGLGLAISHRFCRMMGGDLRVESALGCGSTFTIRIPATLTIADNALRQTSSAAAELEGALQDAAGPESRPVLVIDSDTRRQTVLVQYLKREGFVSVTARNEGEAIELARIVQPFVITVTVRVGESVSHRSMLWLTQDPEIGEIPIVLVALDDGLPRVLSAVETSSVAASIEDNALAAILKTLEAEIEQVPNEPGAEPSRHARASRGNSR